MKDFIDKILNELSTNESLMNNSLVQLLVESTRNSIKTQHSYNAVYRTLKGGLSNINMYLNDPAIQSMLEQFNKMEDTDANKLYKMYNELGLTDIVEQLKKSNIYKDPVAMGFVDQLQKNISEDMIPEFKLYEGFIRVFSQYADDQVVKESIDKVRQYLIDNKKKMLMLEAIHNIQETGQVLYTGVEDKLITMLLDESYSSDVIKMKLTTQLPILNQLVRDLKIEEAVDAKDLNLGGGNEFCSVQDVIAPTMVFENDSAIFFLDNKFFKVEEGKIIKLNSKKVQKNYPDFLKVCETFSKMNFVPNGSNNGLVSEAFRSFKVGIRTNETRNLELYFNESKVDESYDLTELFVLEHSTHNRATVNHLMENLDKIGNIDFCKLIINERLGKSAYVFKAGEKYTVYEAVNAVARKATKMDEVELYNFMIENFHYDVSSIFKIAIDSEIARIKAIDERKLDIEGSLAKLEKTVNDINENLASGEIDEKYHKSLEELRDKVEKSILEYKEEYTALDIARNEKLMEATAEQKEVAEINKNVQNARDAAVAGYGEKNAQEQKEHEETNKEIEALGYDMSSYKKK